MRPFAYHRPRTLAEALERKAETPGSRYVAGGTDLIVRMKDGAVRPPALVSLRSVEGLSGVSADGRVRIGGATTHAALLAHPLVAERYPLLGEALRLLGTPQVRSVATVGGNLGNASPCADCAPPLLCLDAAVLLAGPDGERELPLDGLFVGPGQTARAEDEVLAAVLLGPPVPGARGAFLKKRRVHVDLAQASVAVLALVDAEGVCRHVRIAAGSVAPVPLRLKRTEALLVGRRIDAQLLDLARESAMGEVSPITDLRASADYRRHLVGVFVRRALEGLS